MMSDLAVVESRHEHEHGHGHEHEQAVERRRIQPIRERSTEVGKRWEKSRQYWNE